MLQSLLSMLITFFAYAADMPPFFAAATIFSSLLLFLSFLLTLRFFHVDTLFFAMMLDAIYDVTIVA